jgi:hypothetical protein
MDMKKLELSTYRAAHTVLKRNGFISYPELFKEMRILSDSDFLKWRKGEIPFLEMVVKSNLSKLTYISRVVRKIAQELGLKRSYTFYKTWGKKRHKSPLRFSKSGRREIEYEYSRHYGWFRKDV